MKNILFIAFLTLSVNAFGQTPDTKPSIKLTQPPTYERNRQIPDTIPRVFIYSRDTPVQATNQPLLVVDGVIIASGKDNTVFQNKLKEIKPENIQSIDILKDEKAIEKYGEQGLHGVIVVTMKKK
jgi:uracil phosphoribosyltransferase